MPNYAYKGVDLSGAKIDGQISADNIADAEKRLVKSNVVILALHPASMTKGRSISASNSGSRDTAPEGKGGLFKKKIPVADAADTLRNLAVMAETGVPFVEALESVLISARTPAIADCIRQIRDGIMGGLSLSQAMRLAPEMFPTLVVDMVRIAESGGRLDNALANGATYMERVAELRKKIINAMMYPCVMLTVSIFTLGILIIVVMPKFAQVFTQMKADLPWTTKAMLSAGAFARSNPMGTAGIIFGTLIGLIIASRFPFVKQAVGKIAYRLPVLGDLLRKLALARAVGSLSTLTSSGVPLLHALEHAARVAGGGPIGRALLVARDEVESGRALSDALRDTKVLPATFVQMVAVGERTGRLAPLLTRLSEGIETEVDARLKAVVAIVEPLMIVLMGTIVGGITVSIIGPIYSVVENIK